MTILGYFWAVLAVIGALAAGAFGIGRLIGVWTTGRASGSETNLSGPTVPAGNAAAASQPGTASRKGGVVVGIVVLAIVGVVVGGAKALENHVGPLIVYEGVWLSTALNFALVGGYIAGKKRGEKEPGKQALAFLCGAVALVSIFLMAARLRQVVAVMQQFGIGAPKPTAAGPDTSLNCKASMMRIYDGFRHYVEINDALPPAAKWVEEEDLRGAVQADEWFHCPNISNRKDDKYGYAYNDALAGRKLNGKKLADLPDAAKIPLVYDSSNLTKNAHDPVTSLPNPGRHGARNNILYCDGHIETVAPK